MAEEGVPRSQLERVERRRDRLVRAVLGLFLLVLPLLFAVGGAFAFIQLEKPFPRATAQVIHRDPDLAGPMIGVFTPVQRDGIVLVQLARSPRVVDRVVRAANVPGLTAAGLLERARVTAQGDGNVLEFTVTSASLASALRLANIYASEYAKFRNELGVRAFSSAVEDLRARIASLPRKSAARAKLIRGVQQLSELARLVANRTSVLGQASATTPIRKHALRNGFIGSLLGFLLGTALLLGLLLRFPALRPLVVRPAQRERSWIRQILAADDSGWARPLNSRSAQPGQLP